MKTFHSSCSTDDGTVQLYSLRLNILKAHETLNQCVYYYNIMYVIVLAQDETVFAKPKRGRDSDHA